jgi:hypothetical protein
MAVEIPFTPQAESVLELSFEILFCLLCFIG